MHCKYLLILLILISGCTSTCDYECTGFVVDAASKSAIQDASISYYTITRGKENMEASVETDTAGKFFILAGGKYKGVNCPHTRMRITKPGYRTLTFSPPSVNVGNIYLEKE